MHQNIQHIQFNPDRLDAIERDPVHATVYHLTLSGWPNRVQEMHHIHVTSGTRDELTIADGILLTGNRICIPPEVWEGA